MSATRQNKYKEREKDLWPFYLLVNRTDNWEGDNFKTYRVRLINTLLDAWRDLAPLVDEAFR